MSALEERPEDETGDDAAVTGDADDAPDQDQPRTREPASEEQAEQDNYANTDDEAS